MLKLKMAACAERPVINPGVHAGYGIPYHGIITGCKTRVCSPCAVFAAQAVEAVKAAMVDFLDKKASRLPRRLLEDALRTAPAAGPALLPLPLGRAATAGTAFRRTEALALLGSMLRLPNVRRSTSCLARYKIPPWLCSMLWLMLSSVMVILATQLVSHAALYPDERAPLSSVRRLTQCRLQWHCGRRSNSCRRQPLQRLVTLASRQGTRRR